MKQNKILCLLLAMLMILPLFSMLPVTVVAEDATIVSDFFDFEDMTVGQKANFQFASGESWTCNDRGSIVSGTDATGKTGKYLQGGSGTSFLINNLGDKEVTIEADACFEGIEEGGNRTIFNPAASDDKPSQLLRYRGDDGAFTKNDKVTVLGNVKAPQGTWFHVKIHMVPDGSGKVTSTFEVNGETLLEITSTVVLNCFRWAYSSSSYTWKIDNLKISRPSSEDSQKVLVSDFCDFESMTLNAIPTFNFTAGQNWTATAVGKVVSGTDASGQTGKYLSGTASNTFYIENLGNKAVTIEGDMRFSGINAGENRTLFNPASSQSGTAHILRYRADDGAFMSPDQKTVYGTVKAPQGTWFHFKVTYTPDGAGKVAYTVEINGEEILSNTVTIVLNAFRLTYNTSSYTWDLDNLKISREVEKTNITEFDFSCDFESLTVGDKVQQISTDENFTVSSSSGLIAVDPRDPAKKVIVKDPDKTYYLVKAAVVNSDLLAFIKTVPVSVSADFMFTEGPSASMALHAFVSNSDSTYSIFARYEPNGDITGYDKSVIGHVDPGTWFNIKTVFSIPGGYFATYINGELAEVKQITLSLDVAKAAYFRFLNTYQVTFKDGYIDNIHIQSLPDYVKPSVAPAEPFKELLNVDFADANYEAALSLVGKGWNMPTIDSTRADIRSGQQVTAATVSDGMLKVNFLNMGSNSTKKISAAKTAFVGKAEYSITQTFAFRSTVGFTLGVTEIHGKNNRDSIKLLGVAGMNGDLYTYIDGMRYTLYDENGNVLIAAAPESGLLTETVVDVNETTNTFAVRVDGKRAYYCYDGEFLAAEDLPMEAYACANEDVSNPSLVLFSVANTLSCNALLNIGKMKVN